MKSLTNPTGHCPTCELEVLRNELQSKFVEVNMNVRGRNPMIGFTLQLLCLLAILHISSPLRAQSFYGSIVGTVTDTSGALVPDATVTVTNIGTDEKQTAQSDAEGKISFVNLVPAKYRVEATKAGFKRFLLGSLAVEVGAVVRLDPALQVGADNQTVQVSAETPLLQTDSSTMSQVVTGDVVQQMPLNGRNVENLVALAPGVIPGGSSAGGTGLNQGTRTAGGAGWGNYQIGGAIQGQSVEYMDGVLNNYPRRKPTRKSQPRTYQGIQRCHE
jgi:hypothetical protein